MKQKFILGETYSAISFGEIPITLTVTLVTPVYVMGCRLGRSGVFHYPQSSLSSVTLVKGFEAVPGVPPSKVDVRGSYYTPIEKGITCVMHHDNHGFLPVKVIAVKGFMVTVSIVYHKGFKAHGLPVGSIQVFHSKLISLVV